MRFVHAVLLLTFLGAVAIFAFQNMQAVTVGFLKWSLTAPLALTAVVIYLVGMISGWNVVAFLSRSLHRVATESRER